MQSRTGRICSVAGLAIATLVGASCGSAAPAGAGQASGGTGPGSPGSSASVTTIGGPAGSPPASPGPVSTPGPSAPSTARLKLVAIGDSLDQGKAASCPG